MPSKATQTKVLNILGKFPRTGNFSEYFKSFSSRHRACVKTWKASERRWHQSRIYSDYKRNNNRPNKITNWDSPPQYIGAEEVLGKCENFSPSLNKYLMSFKAVLRVFAAQNLPSLPRFFALSFDKWRMLTVMRWKIFSSASRSRQVRIFAAELNINESIRTCPISKEINLTKKVCSHFSWNSFRSQLTNIEAQANDKQIRFTTILERPKWFVVQTRLQVPFSRHVE